MDKNNNNPPIPSDFFLYKNSNGEVKVEIYIFNETVWLPQDKIAQLFGVDRSIVTEHLKNVYKSGELSKGVTCAIFAQVQIEGTRQVTRQIEFYNLDVIRRLPCQQYSSHTIWNLGEQCAERISD